MTFTVYFVAGSVIMRATTVLRYRFPVTVVDIKVTHM